MKTVSGRDLNQLAVSGARVKRVTETRKPPAPAPEIPDHAPEIAAISKRQDEITAQNNLFFEAVAEDLGTQRKVLDHVSRDVVALKHRVEEVGTPKQMTVSRGLNGFIDAVTVGGLVFQFKRNRVGSVEMIDIRTTK